MADDTPIIVEDYDPPGPYDGVIEAVEQSTAVSGLAVEAAIASADETKTSNEELRKWLEEKLTILESNSREANLQARERLQEILERLSTMESQLSSQKAENPSENQPEEVIVMDPETTAQPTQDQSESNSTLNPSEDGADGNQEPRTNRKRKRFKVL